MTRSAFEAAGHKFSKEGLSDRVNSIVVSAIKEMAVLAADYPDAISFGWGLPSFKTPNFILDGLTQELKSNPDIGKYAPMPGWPPLKETIKKKIQKQFKVDVDAKREILVTAGAMEGLMAAILSIVNPGDEVILTSPGFSSHIEQIMLAGGKPVFVPLIEETGWQLDIEGFKKAFTKKTKAIILCNPSNPTGSIFSESNLRELAEIATKNNIFIITDEPYQFLVYENNKLFPLISEPNYHDHLIACYSLSKEYAMSGFRVGYVFARERVIQAMMKVHDATIISVPSISQVAAKIALDGPQDCVREFQKAYTFRRDLMCDQLDKLGNMFDYQKPQGSYYIFPKIKIPHKNSFDFALRLLKEAGVVTVPGDAFGPTGKNHVRLCFCVEEDEIIEGMKRLIDFSAKL